MIKRPQNKPIPVMERRIPKSAKYAHIEAKLDTGLNINKVKIITAQQYAQRRDEIFFRITKHQLYELFNEYEADERETIAGLSPERRDTGPHIVTYSEQDQPEYSKPYLILDVREIEAYNSCHLLQAKSYPYTMIRRDLMLPDIYKFKNKEEHLIIIYCDDERISRDTAKTMVDRGIDNVYLLEGGLTEFASYFPAFIEGVIPERMIRTPPRSGLTRSRLHSINEDGRSTASSRSIMSAGLSSIRPSAYAGTSRRQSTLSTARSRDGRSDAGSTVSNMSVAGSVISRASSRKGRF